MNNVNFGISSTTITVKISRIYVSDAIDFCTKFKNAAKLSIEL